MDAETKAKMMCSAQPAAGLKGKRVCRDVKAKGHPFSHCEMKPIQLWQRLCEHHQVTHIVDFSPGSGALALAASGGMAYEGICGSQPHRDWLDATLDRCVMYMAGKDKNYFSKSVPIRN